MYADKKTTTGRSDMWTDLELRSRQLTEASLFSRCSGPEVCSPGRTCECTGGGQRVEVFSVYVQTRVQATLAIGLLDMEGQGYLFVAECPCTGHRSLSLAVCAPHTELSLTVLSRISSYHRGCPAEGFAADGCSTDSCPVRVCNGTVIFHSRPLATISATDGFAGD